MDRFILYESGSVDNRRKGAEDGQKSDGNYSRGDSVHEELTKLHKLAVDGDKEAVKKAHELAKKMYAANPRSPLAEAYMGSTISLLGRDAMDPNERFKLAMDGVKRLDEAVSHDPNNNEIRILRGYVNLRLPETFFHRTMNAIEDFEYLINSYEKNNSIFSSDLYCQLLYDLGDAYKTVEKKSKCDQVWSKLLSVAQDPKYRRLVGNTDSAVKFFDEIRSGNQKKK